LNSRYREMHQWHRPSPPLRKSGVCQQRLQRAPAAKDQCLANCFASRVGPTVPTTFILRQRQRQTPLAVDRPPTERDQPLLGKASCQAHLAPKPGRRRGWFIIVSVLPSCSASTARH
jgi:hypothetical protein